MLHYAQPAARPNRVCGGGHERAGGAARPRMPPSHRRLSDPVGAGGQERPPMEKRDHGAVTRTSMWRVTFALLSLPEIAVTPSSRLLTVVQQSFDTVTLEARMIQLISVDLLVQVDGKEPHKSRSALTSVWVDWQCLFLRQSAHVHVHTLQGVQCPTPTQSTCLYFCHGNEAN
jgi:hypothetical protein